jgi:hypothetical protein
VFTARYALSPSIKQIRFVFKGLINRMVRSTSEKIFQKQVDQCEDVAWSNDTRGLILDAKKKGERGCWISNFFPNGATAPSGPELPYYRGFTITLKTHHTLYDSSGRVISPSQRPLPNNTQHSQTYMPPVGIEPAIPESERPQTNALDRAATGEIGK